MPLELKDRAYLRDMLRYARTVRDLVAGMSYAQYARDHVRQLAVERGLEIVGEAANRVSTPTRASHPEIAWQPIISQRNVLAHEYGKIQQDKIWAAATVHTSHTSVLIRQLEALVPDDPDLSSLPWNVEA